MQYNTALGFALGGIGMLCMHYHIRRASLIIGGLVASIGSLTLLQYIFNIELGIDQLFIEYYIKAETPYPGRMAPNTAMCFSMIGFGMDFLIRIDTKIS